MERARVTRVSQNKYCITPASPRRPPRPSPRHAAIVRPERTVTLLYSDPREMSDIDFYKCCY